MELSYTLDAVHKQKSKRFNTDIDTFTLRFKDLGTNKIDGFFKAMEEALNKAMEPYANGDKIGVEISHLSFDHSVLVPFSDKNSMTIDKVLSVMERVQQSKREFEFSEAMIVKVVAVKNPSGGGKTTATSQHKIVNFNEWFTAHSGHGGCFIQVKNK